MERSPRAPLFERGKVGWVGDGSHKAPVPLAHPTCPVASGAWGSHGPRFELHGHWVPARGPYLIPSLLEPQSGFQGLLPRAGRAVSGPYWVGGLWLGKKSLFCQLLHGRRGRGRPVGARINTWVIFLPIRTNGWALGSLLWGQPCLLTGFGLSGLSSTDDSVPGSSYPLSMKLLPLLKHLSSALWEGHLQPGGPKTLSGVRSHGRGGVGCRPEGRWVSSWAAFGG